MEKANLIQIKTFYVSAYFTTDLLDKAVNDYVVEIYKKEKCFPEIKTNSKFISVIYKSLREI